MTTNPPAEEEKEEEAGSLLLRPPLSSVVDERVGPSLCRRDGRFGKRPARGTTVASIGSIGSTYLRTGRRSFRAALPSSATSQRRWGGDDPPSYKHGQCMTPGAIRSREYRRKKKDERIARERRTAAEILRRGDRGAEENRENKTSLGAARAKEEVSTAGRGALLPMKVASMTEAPPSPPVPPPRLPPWKRRLDSCGRCVDCRREDCRKFVY